MPKPKKNLCECGCGELTANRFLRGHNNHNGNKNGNKNNRWRGGRNINKKGYVLIKLPDHPRSDPQGYVREHIIICEKALGKPLPENTMPHHYDENKSNNENTNLILCQNDEYHKLIHRRTKAYIECGHASWRKCRYCHRYDDPSILFIKGSKVRHVFRCTANRSGGN